MVERHWKGTALPEKAEEYVHHLLNDTFPALKALPGFISHSILRRETELGMEFLIITRWETMEALRPFAGVDIERAVIPSAVKSMMVRYDLHAEHYAVVLESK
jgi:heme-degrading monooxygenase HmoA